MIVYGAGSGGGRETFLTGAAVGQASSNSETEIARVDAQSATRIAAAANCITNGVTWALYGSNASDFSGETLVHGPEALTPKAASLSFSDATPGFRYYRAKIVSTTPDLHGTTYVTISAWGYVLGASILSVESPTECTLDVNAGADRDSAYAYFGTDDTEAIQTAIDAMASLVPPGTADGGIRLEVPRGRYLLSDQITHRYCVDVSGHSGGGSIFMLDGEAFPENVAAWNMTGLFATEVRIAFFTRLSNVRIDCGHVPGSIGIFCDALQENSGLYKATVIQWCSIGIKVCDDLNRYGCVNWIIEDPWIYPSITAFLDDAARGIAIDYSLYTTIRRGTVIGQGGFICGYGKSVEVKHGSVQIQGQLHMEAARIGVHFDEGGSGTVDGVTCQSFVEEAVVIEGGNPVLVQNITTTGRVALRHPLRGYENTDSFVPWYLGTLDTVPLLLGGPFQLVGEPTNPNIVTLNDLNFDEDYQGGWLSVNSRSGNYPFWHKTSSSASDNALFMRLGASVFELRIGQADQPGFVAEGVCDVNGTTVTRVSGDTFDLGWAAGTQITLFGNGVGVIASVTSTSELELNASAGTLVGVTFGVSTDANSFGGTDPGRSWLRVEKDVGAQTPRLYFDENTTEPMEFGNNIGANRFRWRHGGTGQVELALQMSQDSGGAWTDLLQIHTTGEVKVMPAATLYFDDAADPGKRPLNFGNQQGTYRARWTQGQADQLLVALERSADGGSSWEKFLWCYLDKQFHVNGSVAFGPSSPSSGPLGTAEFIDGTVSGITDVRMRASSIQTINEPVFRVQSNGRTDGARFFSTGRADVKALGVNYDKPAFDGYVHVELFVGIGTETRTALNEGIRNERKTLLNDSLRLNNLTASLPLKLDGNKDVIAQKIDLGASADIAGTGLTTGSNVKWDGSKLVSGYGTIAISDITGLQAALDALDARITALETDNATLMADYAAGEDTLGVGFNAGTSKLTLGGIDVTTLDLGHGRITGGS